MEVEDARLAAFLVAAKRATYAGQGDEATVRPLLPGTRQLEFRDGDLSYRDVYAGMGRFAGQEIVCQGDRPIWSMAYAGGVSAPDPSAAEIADVYAFLRGALRLVRPDRPFRGPGEHRRGAFRYTARISGDLTAFEGREVIMRDGRHVYRLIFAGGRLR